MSTHHRHPTAPVVGSACSDPAGTTLVVEPNDSASVPISGWTYTTWKRQIHWPLLATAIGLTVVAVAVTTTGYVLGLLSVPIAGAALGALAALWHWYLALAVSGVTARRPAPAAEADTDHSPAASRPIELTADRAELVATSRRPDPIPRRLPAQRTVPALTTTTSKPALEATP